MPVMRRSISAITLVVLSASPLFPLSPSSRQASATALTDDHRLKTFVEPLDPLPIALPPDLAPEPGAQGGDVPAQASAASQTDAHALQPARETVHVTLYSVNKKETLTIDLPVDGIVDPELGQELAHFFRCLRRQREKPMSAGVLGLLADIARKFPGQTIEIISGYRSPPYGAPRSKHFKGNAIDLRVRGVRLTKVRDAIWTSHTGIGVGWYPEQNFIHVDYRPDEPDMSWTAKHEGAPNRYHPYWADKSRREAKAAEAALEQQELDLHATISVDRHTH
jgi:uncharacterized protein YcbK (DUF882 family)